VARKRQQDGADTRSKTRLASVRQLNNGARASDDRHALKIDRSRPGQLLREEIDSMCVVIPCSPASARRFRFACIEIDGQRDRDFVDTSLATMRGRSSMVPSHGASAASDEQSRRRYRRNE